MRSLGSDKFSIRIAAVLDGPRAIELDALERQELRRLVESGADVYNLTDDGQGNHRGRFARPEESGKTASERWRDMEASRKRREVEAKLEKGLSCGNKLDCLSSGMGRSRKKSCCNPFLLWKRAPDETGRFIALWALAAQPESAFPARDSGPGDGRLRVAKSRRTEGLLVLRLVCLADTRRLETPPPLSSNDGLDLIDDSGR